MRKVYYYPTVSAFANDVDNGKTNKVFINANIIASQDVRKDSWSGTKTYQEARTLLVDGDEKSAELIRKYGAIHTPKRTHVNVPIPVASVYGFRPHIPNYLAGIPEDMWSTKQVPIKKKIITIVIAEAVCFTWTSKELADVNAKVVSAIKMIENGGVRVNLYTLFASRKNNEEIGALIKVKEAGRNISIEKMAYTMVNPAFFRRHYFRFLETRKELADENWPYGYGAPGSLDMCEEMLKEEGFKYHYLCHITSLKDYSPEQIKELFEEGNAKS